MFRMFSIALLIVACSMPAAVWCIAAAQAMPPSPDSQYAAAYEEAKATGKPLLVLAGADWCEPCKALKPYYPQFQARGPFFQLDVDRRPHVLRGLLINVVPKLLVWRWDRYRHRWTAVEVRTGPDEIRAYLNKE